MTKDEIKRNAPESATHYFEHTKNYLKNKRGTWYVWNQSKWMLVKQITYLQSIKDSIKPL